MGRQAAALAAQAQFSILLTRAYAETPVAASASHGVEIRVYSLTPFLELVADDRVVALSDARVEALQRVLALLLNAPDVSLRRLSDEPAWRRGATWSRAWAPAAGQAPHAGGSR